MAQLPNTATKQEIKDAHKIELAARKILRERYRKMLPKRHIFANLSKNHPFYGDTPSEHERRKLQEKSS